MTGAATLGARRPLARRTVALVLACVCLLAGTTVRRGSGVAPRTVEVAQVQGAGSWDKLACFSCLAVLAGSAGGSIGGVLIYAMLFPEAYGACAYICYGAFS